MTLTSSVLPSAAPAASSEGRAVASGSPFVHNQAAHCESGTVASLVTHYGQPLSEPMAFGLGSGLGFAYLPFIHIQEMPLIAYRAPPRGIIRGVRKSLGMRFRIERFSSEAAGEERLNHLLDRGVAVGLQTSVYWLPYFPEDMRFHFNAHNLVVYGRDGDDYLISDPVGEYTVRCHRDDLRRARFAKGMLAPKGTLYYPDSIGQAPDPANIRASIRRVIFTMLAPVPIVGVRGIQTMARRIGRLDPKRPDDSRFVGHIVRMQEEIGTGGAGFRFLYAAFLQEAAETQTGLRVLSELSERLMAIGDEWRVFALSAARMVKGRETFDPPALAALLQALAVREKSFFRDLKAAAA